MPGSGVLPATLGELAGLPLDQWLSALALPQGLLADLDAYGVEQPSDLAYLEVQELEALCAGLNIVRRRKLERGWRALRASAGLEGLQAGDLAAAPDFPTSPQQRRPSPTARNLSSCDLDAHVERLRTYCSRPDATAAARDSVISSLHIAWAACVADPIRRSTLLPIIVEIAKQPQVPETTAISEEAALALVFLSFSLSGCDISAVGPVSSNCVVFVFGWLGSKNAEFESLCQHYQQSYPGCRVLTTVAGGDRWAQATHTNAKDKASDSTGTDASSPPRFSQGSKAEWPVAALCEEQIWRLAEAMLPDAERQGGAPAPRTFFHLFSNGFTLYVRLLMHLKHRADNGESCCAAAMKSIRGVVFDSTPAWGPKTTIPPPQIVKLVAMQSVAAVLKKESIPGMSLRDVAPGSTLNAVVNTACDQSQNAVFDSTWHYDWALQHEPCTPALFVYSKVDRTTRQEAIEGWFKGNRDRWETNGRKVSKLLLSNTSHCMHWFKAQPRYAAALAELAKDWYVPQ